MSSDRTPHRPPAPLPHELPGTDNLRLWTPWRMKYVGGAAVEDGCLFCNRLAGDRDADALILHRGERVFAVMNLFPYNTGHLMIVPNEHVPGPEEAAPRTLAEMAVLLSPLTRATRRVLGCAGFNIGMNVGAVAGAGIAVHLHQHVVPRWLGDANFMPILASTMVVPELIPITYAKLRAELQRELAPPAPDGDRVTLLVLTPDRSRFLLAGDHPPRLPTVTAEPSESLWRAAQRAAQAAGDVELLGWGGLERAGTGPAALAFVTAAAAPSGGNWQPIHDAARGGLPPEDADLLSASLARFG